MFKSIKIFAADESGVTAIEYALIASLIAVFIITAVQTVGTKVSTVFKDGVGYDSAKLIAAVKGRVGID